MPKDFIGNGACGTEKAFKIIGTKWKPQIIAVCNYMGNVTFTQLKQQLEGISDSMLSRQTQSVLIEYGFVLKNDYKEKIRV